MNTKVNLSFVAACAILSACQTIKIPQATGGSKADGTISMTYSVGPYEVPVVDAEKERVDAAERCKVWGYKDAQAFGGSKLSCVDLGCNAKNVTTDYQCIN